ncbi:DMT family transporter [bacterium]|nr:DMT family transporter [bacterium]
MSRAARAYLGLSFTSLLWAGAFIAGKLVTAELTPLAAAGLRHLAATLVLLPFAWRMRRAANLRAALPSLAVMAVCGGVLYQWAFMAALQRTSATNAALLVALNPALTVLLAPLVGEALTAGRVAGILLALAGATVVITHGDLAILAGLAAARGGDLLALAAACLWAIFNLASRGAVAHLPHAMTNAVTYGVGSLVTLSLALPTAPFAQLAAASAPTIAALAFLVVFASVLAGQLFLFGVHSVGVGRTVVFVYLVPVLTALLSALLLGEPLLPSQVLGGALVLLGVAVTTRARDVRRPSAVRGPLLLDAER